MCAYIGIKPHTLNSRSFAFSFSGTLNQIGQFLNISPMNTDGVRDAAFSQEQYLGASVLQVHTAHVSL